jgi:hypothetical protein
VAQDRAAAEEALELAIQVGVQGAAERLGVDKATLYLAWRRWGLGRPTDREEGARATAARKLAASRRADRARASLAAGPLDLAAQAADHDC